ncbi:MAG TPA: protein translocase subunit SecD, partial [Burkholderiales bacterium]|nr:protein translocase subunit SecD [Burkholderiales bacterium]
MNDFPKWKYALIAVVILLGFVYASPNLFPPQPAVQISANRGGKVDEALKEKVLGILQTNKLEFRSVELNGDRMLARFANTDAQFAAQDLLKTSLGDDYIVAPNLASSVPSWLRAIGANAMPKGLDLQGGVHFLMEVDAKAALDKMQERYIDDTRAALRKANIRGTVNSG